MALLKSITSTWGLWSAVPSTTRGTNNLTGATLYDSQSIILDSARTLSKLRVFNATGGGTRANIAVDCILQADNNGAPGTVLETKSITAGNWVANDTWAEFTGFSTALSANTMYWITFTNVSASPGTDYPQLIFYTSASTVLPLTLGTGANAWGYVRRTSSDGTTWAAGAATMHGMRLEFNDSGAITYWGYPFTQQAVASTVSPDQRVYGNRAYGALFTTPQGPSLKIRGIRYFHNKTGSPTDLIMSIYSGGANGALIGSCAAIPAANATASQYNQVYTTSVITLSPGTDYRAVITTSGGNTTNYYRGYHYLVEDNAESKALIPYGWKATFTSDITANPIVWTDYDTLMPCNFALLLDTDGEFAAGSSGGLLTHPGMGGGMRG